ncbi:RcpC/CpaB family pilus assembly protein [Vibrio gigantis]|uniref:RcpC/CpaB family pilus assembly protein n=1 Tax=Vibrio gigantis TaxID=296199 RepID=UPI001BFD332F|nr:RcpC/CpaB family pilus assembly protein [Vibrio gigantis]
MNSKIILGLAVVAISIGLYGVTQTPSTKEIPTQSVNQVEPKVLAWQLKRDVVQGDKLVRRDFEAVYFTRQQAGLHGLTEDTRFTWQQSLFAKQALQQGGIVTPELLTSPGQADYLNTVIEPGFVPFNVTVPGEDVVGGTISVGDLVDISVLSAPKQNLANDKRVDDIQHLTMTPLLAQVPVLDMVSRQRSVSTLSSEKVTEMTLVLQVTNRQVAQLTIAKRIAEIEVHKSIGEEFSDDLEADSSDVISLSGQRDEIREYRFK